MRCIQLNCVMVILGLGLTSCSPEPTSSASRNDSDVMNISTWDFGEIDDVTPLQMTTVGQSQKDQFAIAVATFTGSAHREEARSTLSSLAMQYTIGRSLKLRKRSRGSVLTYGNYSGYDDPNAKQDIAMLRSIPTRDGRALFAQVLLTKFKSPRARQQLHPHDLWTVRREFPTIVPIYTLEVAVWGDFKSGQFPRNRRRTAAEQYANELRSKGYEAFFYHNDDSELSSVTVGLFSFTAFDAETGFYSPEVEAMLSRFPKRLVNGEPVLEYINPQNQSQGTKVQPPCLAEVPVD